MNTCTERPTDPPEFEDEERPEIDHDIARKEIIESDITGQIMDALRIALRDIGKPIK